MKIDGKEIAFEIFEDLKKKVSKLKENGIIPHLVVILVGEDPASKAYVRQKELKTIEIGAKYTGFHLPDTTTEKELLSLIEKLNKDNTIHGLIVQLPLPNNLNEDIALKVKPERDIDAFNPLSPYPMPLAAAVLKILNTIFLRAGDTSRGAPCGGPALISAVGNVWGWRVAGPASKKFSNWLKSKKIVVVGKGKTGGGPTIAFLKKMGAQPQVIDSKTENPDSLTKNADIIISAVGRPNIIKPEMIKKRVILITVGMYRGDDGKLHGDYNEEEIKDIASFYTPVPGGVGPVNVAMLLENLVTAAEKGSK